MSFFKRGAAVLLASCLAFAVAGCSSGTPTDESASMDAATEAEMNQASADEVAAMIDALYAEQRTDQTDSQCEEARAAWDALTPEQQALVKGVQATPDYFGLDTGDASADDPMNGDDIGFDEILVVSDGTSYNESRVADIGGIERAVKTAFPNWQVRRAFTDQAAINHIRARDGEAIDNVDQALERAVANGVKNLVVIPASLTRGAAFEELRGKLAPYEESIGIIMCEPLIGEVDAQTDEYGTYDEYGDGSDYESSEYGEYDGYGSGNGGNEVVYEDVAAVVEAAAPAIAKAAGFESPDYAAGEGVAIVLVGNGSARTDGNAYQQLMSQMSGYGYYNVFIGTVEGEIEGTACSDVIESVKSVGFQKVVLLPLAVAASDDFYNDVADLENSKSWASQFKSAGFAPVDCEAVGLGQVPEIQQILLNHLSEIASQ